MFRTGRTAPVLVLAAAACLLCRPAPASAQAEATVRGRVVAAADRSPISGVMVTLTSAAGEAVTAPVDGSGRFAFQLVEPGVYTLSAGAAGFAAYDAMLTLEAREVRTVTLALALQRIEAAVEVIGSGPGLSTVSPSSTILTSTQLDEATPSERRNLTDAIVAAAPGMIRGHDDFVHVRGHEVALVPVLNGVSFWENPHVLFSPGVSPGVIERVSVMTGAFPAEFGNRFGGVLDIVTKSGTRMHHDGSVSFGLGEAGRRNVDGEFGGHRGRFGYYAFGAMFESDRFLSPPDPAAIHDSGRSGRGFLQLDASLGGIGTIRLIASGDGATFEIPLHPRDLDIRPQARSTQRTRQQSAIAGWNRAGMATAVSASLYGRWSTMELSPASGPLTAVARQARDLSTIGGKVDVTRVAGRHAFKTGGDVVRLRPHERLFYDYSGYSAFTHLLGWPHIHVPVAVDFSARETGGQVSVYAQDALHLGDRVSAHLGLRVDRYDLLVTDTHASPRVNVAVRAAGGVTVHTSYNRFFVPPPIEGVLASSAGLTAAIREIGVALPALEPSIEDQFEAGAARDVGPLRLSLTGYHRSTGNPVHTTVWPDSRIYTYASFDRARSFGMEAKVDLQGAVRHGLTGYLRYALGRVDYYNPVTGGFVTEGAHLTDASRFLAPMDQTHTVGAGGSWRHARSGLMLAASMEYGSGTPVGHGSGDHSHGAGEQEHAHTASTPAALRVPDHLVGNVAIGLDLLRGNRSRGRLRLRLDVESVSNRPYLVAQEGEFSPAQYSAPRLIGASVSVGF